MKTALRNMIHDLTSSSIRISVLFYGAATAVDVVHAPGNGKESFERIKTKIEQKQFRPDSVNNSSKLYDAFNEVERICSTSCRDIFTPRVTVVLTSAKQPVIENIETARLGSLLRMTVIAIGIGMDINRTALTLIASEPFTYTISIDSFSSLIMSAQHITSLVLSVPPVLHYVDSPPAKYYDEDDLDFYNTIQYVVTSPKDHVVVVSFETDACCNNDTQIKVYASKFDPMPTRDNSEETRSYTSERCDKANRF
ncbi:unnamed protein product, partial [Rotaria sp. Silwood2]